MSFYWLMLVIFGAILAYNFVLLNKKTVCKADRNTQGFDYLKLLNRHKNVLIGSVVLILVIGWIIWVNQPSPAKNKPIVASPPAKAAVQAASSPTQVVVRVDKPQTRTTLPVTPPPVQPMVQEKPQPARAAVKEDPPPRPDWLHVGTEKKGWSLRIAAPSTWTKRNK
jgi:hypothetical protein